MAVSEEATGVVFAVRNSAFSLHQVKIPLPDLSFSLESVVLHGKYMIFVRKIFYFVARV